MKKCCFFGHARFAYENCRETIKYIVIDLIEHHGVTVFYSGGRGDFDGMCTRIVGEVRKDYPHIENLKFLSYIPTSSAADNYLAPYYTGTVYLLEKKVIPKFAISRTNEKAVDICDFVVSGVCRSYGGAQQAVKYANRKRKAVIEIFSDTAPLFL